MSTTDFIRTKSIADAWNLYQSHLADIAKTKEIALAQTALIRYTLPGYGWEGLSIRSVAERKENALQFMKGIELSQLVNGIRIQQSVFDTLGCKASLQRSNRYRLRGFLKWCKLQPWWSKALNSTAKQQAPKRRNNQGNANHTKISGKTKQSSYSLKELEPSAGLGLAPEAIAIVQQQLDRIAAELEQFVQFRTSAYIPGRQEDPVRLSTANKDKNRIYLILGWLYHDKRVPLADLGLAMLDDISLTHDYTQWLRDVRHGSAASELQAVVAFLNVAKFLHYQDSDQQHCEALTKSYVDIEIINQLRKLSREVGKRLKASPKAWVNESKKWLDWPQYLACLSYLKEDCLSLTSLGRKRSDQAIARSYERYLIAALLGYMPPDRQRTFRELELGRTLVRGTVEQGVFCPAANESEPGYWYIRLMAEDYKTGATYGEQIIPVPEILYPELEAWLNQWRACLNPNHNFVFTQLNGKPLTAVSLYQLFRHAIYRASSNLFGEGKATNPQLVRTILITHCFRMGASDAEMEALAVGMKHSRRMQRQVYDRRTQQERIQPALDLMARLGEPQTS